MSVCATRSDFVSITLKQIQEAVQKMKRNAENVFVVYTQSDIMNKT